jgi:hypothetical protein
MYEKIPYRKGDLLLALKKLGLYLIYLIFMVAGIAVIFNLSITVWKLVSSGFHYLWLIFGL